VAQAADTPGRLRAGLLGLGPCKQGQPAAFSVGATLRSQPRSRSKDAEAVAARSGGLARLATNAATAWFGCCVSGLPIEAGSSGGPARSAMELELLLFPGLAAGSSDGQSLSPEAGAVAWAGRGRSAPAGTLVRCRHLVGWIGPNGKAPQWPSLTMVRPVMGAEGFSAGTAFSPRGGRHGLHGQRADRRPDKRPKAQLVSISPAQPCRNLQPVD